MRSKAHSLGDAADGGQDLVGTVSRGRREATRWCRDCDPAKIRGSHGRAKAKTGTRPLFSSSKTDAASETAGLTAAAIALRFMPRDSRSRSLSRTFKNRTRFEVHALDSGCRGVFCNSWLLLHCLISKYLALRCCTSKLFLQECFSLIHAFLTTFLNIFTSHS